jgi:hypothetical protein
MTNIEQSAPNVNTEYHSLLADDDNFDPFEALGNAPDEHADDNPLLGFEREEAFRNWFYAEVGKFDRGEPAMVRREGNVFYLLIPQWSKTAEAQPVTQAPAHIKGANGKLQPDREQLSIFIETLFKYATAGNWVSLRSFPDKGSGSNKPFAITPVKLTGNLDALTDKAYRAAELAANARDKIVFCPPVATFTNKDHAREKDLAEGLVLSVECDTQRLKPNWKSCLVPRLLLLRAAVRGLMPTHRARSFMTITG